MPRDQAYYEAEKKIKPVNNHPRTLRQAQGKFLTTNKRMRADLTRVFVTPFVDGTVETKGGHHAK